MNKKIILCLICFCFVLVAYFFVVSNPRVLSQDSGWDSSYDSGSSDWSSSDSSWSGSDWSSSGSSSSGSNLSSKDSAVVSLFIIAYLFFILMTVIGFWVIIFFVIRKSVKVNHSNYSTTIMTQEEINQIDSSISIEALSNYTFELYRKIQVAWMNFDYDSLKKLVSDELYNQYKMQLEALNLKKQQNIMSDFKLLDFGVFSVRKSGNVETVVVKLNVSMYDYVINAMTNDVVRGSKTSPINITYRIVLEKSLSKLEYCPQCGAKIGDSSRQNCPYCNSVISKLGTDFVMTKKINIGQR